MTTCEGSTSTRVPVSCTIIGCSSCSAGHDQAGCLAAGACEARRRGSGAVTLRAVAASSFSCALFCSKTCTAAPSRVSRCVREVGMADGRRQCVRAVVRARVVIKGKDVPHHKDHLAFVRRPRTHHCLLDLHGRVLPQLEPGLCSGDKGCATRVCRCKCRAGVLSKEDFSMASWLGAYVSIALRCPRRSFPGADRWTQMRRWRRNRTHVPCTQSRASRPRPSPCWQGRDLCPR